MITEEGQYIRIYKDTETISRELGYSEEKRLQLMDIITKLEAFAFTCLKKREYVKIPYLCSIERYIRPFVRAKYAKDFKEKAEVLNPMEYKKYVLSKMFAEKKHLMERLNFRRYIRMLKRHFPQHYPHIGERFSKKEADLFIYYLYHSDMYKSQEEE